MDWNLSRGAVVVDCCRRRGSNYCSYCHRHTHRRCGSCIALCCGKVTAASIYSKVFALIRKQSPMTLISPYHGDVCATTESLYTRSAPQPNTTDSTGCTDPTETGDFFHPSEMHGITIQVGGCHSGGSDDDHRGCDAGVVVIVVMVVDVMAVVGGDCGCFHRLVSS
eukprot:m.184903 g.184903  ORF g.184903 m.184903 type:complete len:166 (+) comp32212_c0_seq3:8-505(+)